MNEENREIDKNQDLDKSTNENFMSWRKYQYAMTLRKKKRQ